MADQVIPHFQNDGGVESIKIGAREFMCIGATPPFDHPHVFLDMGDETSIVCPYCSTLYVCDASLKPGMSVPADCLWVAAEAAE
ncbi:zinc-finger domain-containing protein [Breoghania sp.]|uniref:zinc-finger domain-containing protein n=1 Tax=Breoghania sp. TaxID=2065378 RepID=UPI002AA911ED|nr:zinc-finger domain-containing protein [Breoghania sp.]